jgi:hypothetical protein
VSTFKFLQKVSQPDFKQITEQMRGAGLHVMRDPKPGGLKMDHVVGRVSSAFNLGKKVEVTANILYDPKDEVKLTKDDGVWYLVIKTNSNK